MPDAAADSSAITAPVADVNPIAWGQFHLRGGWKSFWPTTLGYAAVVGAGMLLVVRLAGGTPNALEALKNTFTALHAGLMILFVATRVSTAIRQDQTNRMIESHRLSPMSPPQAVLGYLLGPAAQPLALCAANLLLGCGLCQATGTPLVLWFTVNAVLLLFSMFATTVAAFGAFAGRPGGAAVGWIASFVGMINFMTIGAILPAVNVLSTPLLNSSIFNMSLAGGDAVATYAPSTVFQFAFAGVCFAASCRRYRRDDRPAMGWDLGLLLLAAWIATSAFGIVFWDQYEPPMMRGRAVEPSGQLLGSMFAAMLFALVPLAGSAWHSTDWEGRLALGDRPPGRRPPAPLFVVVAAAALTLCLTLAVTTSPARSPVDAPVAATLWTAAVVVAFYAATSYVMRILVRVTAKLLYPLMVWVMLSCFVPLAVDYVRWWIDGASPNDPTLAAASAFGPVGALVRLWTGDGRGTAFGIVFQVALAAALGTAYYATRPRWAKKNVAPTP